MGQYHIHGKKRLMGEVKVSGGKNAILPILAATVLNSGISIIHNCPQISDVCTGIKILEEIGCKIKWEGHTLIVNSKDADNYCVPEELVKEMRSSIIFLGSILGRLGKVKITFPGGCVIGERPIDLHIKALRAMGASITEESGFLIGEAKKLEGTTITLDIASVGATENTMLAAVFAKGTTVIYNAAREPEIIDLEMFLNACGAKIKGAGTDIIQIEGVESLYDSEHCVMPDRIEAGTFLIAGAITGGEIMLKNAEMHHIFSVIHKLQEMGCDITEDKSGIVLRSPRRLVAVDKLTTSPYPGFPTDMQSQFMSLLTLAKGTSMVVETVFESRYKHVGELNRMGANISIDGRIAVVKGVDRLHGSTVCATDLRAGACLILAGLAAEGTTIVTNSNFIERGYESIDTKLNAMGADVRFIH